MFNGGVEIFLCVSLLLGTYHDNIAEYHTLFNSINQTLLIFGSCSN